MARNIAHRTVPLSTRGDRLEFDVAAGVYRVVYYRQRPGGSGAKKDEERFAVERKTLADALQVVFGEADGCPHDPVVVEEYLRSTSWGRKLP